MKTIRKTDEKRLYQHEGVVDCFKALKSHRRVCYVLPTGGGKTWVAARMLQQRLRQGRRCIVLAHRTEIIEQMIAALVRDSVPIASIGRIRADDDTNLDAPIQVASVQTLIRRGKPRADFVVVDECHHAVAESWDKLLAWYPDAKILGLTATPIRMSGRGLEGSFDEIVHGPVFSELVAMGHLVVPRVFGPAEMPDLSEVTRSRGIDFDEKKLAKAMNKPRLIGNIVVHYQREANGLRAAVYAVDVEHAYAIAASFLEAGVAAECVHAGTSLRDRAAMLGPKGRLARGVTRIVVNVGVLTEGWDLPQVKCAIIARPTKSLSLHIQMSGRVVRIWRENGIPVKPIILDHAGNCLTLNAFAHADRVYRLDEPRRTGRKGEAPLKQCPVDGLIQPAGNRVCPECGTAFVMADRKAVGDGELVELGKPTEAELQKAWALMQKAVASGCPTIVAEKAWAVRFPGVPVPEAGV